jgi:hypothetical protein
MSADFDEAIDGAVREMLAVEPRVDLRERVIAQLPASGFRRPASGFRLPVSSWVLGSMAAAIVVLAVFVARRSEPVPTAVVARGDIHLPAPPVAAPPAPARVQPAASSAPPAPTASPSVARAPGIVAAASLSGEAAGAAIAPLNSIAPISVASIAPSNIAPGDIAVRPLNPIAEVQIAPLTPPDRR